jgi:hypothetical protein
MLSTSWKILLLIACATMASQRANAASCAFPVAAQFTEDMITLSWGDVRDAHAYNVYADCGNGFVKANFAPIAVRNRFSFLWIDSAGKKERVVKGNRVTCRVVPLLASVSSKNDTVFSEGPAGCSVQNDYFRGFSGVLSDSAFSKILEPRQRCKKIFATAVSVAGAAFRAGYARPARSVFALYKSRIDPKDEGACVPFSTIVAKYFTKRGITCYRAQGLFVGSFHSFNLVVVDSVEYILDFTADQYVPQSSPVFMPRDYCFADSCGAPTSHPAGTFTAFYRIDKVFTADQIAFAETPKAREYQQALDSLERQ